mmetsp:Transcript_8463/g.17915  ORF Transcript_8463/g.17915 Transcript_8463/m.17915 type:complete len:215 (+) Transcript_8463:62-706(+)|eukprot:s3014_g4.t1
MMMEPVTRLPSSTAAPYPAGTVRIISSSYATPGMHAYQPRAVPFPSVPTGSIYAPGLPPAQGCCLATGLAAAARQLSPELVSSPPLPPVQSAHYTTQCEAPSQWHSSSHAVSPLRMASPVAATPAVPSGSPLSGSMVPSLSAPFSCRSSAFGAAAPAPVAEPEVAAEPAEPAASRDDVHASGEALTNFHLPQTSQHPKKKGKAQKDKKRCACCN